MRQLDKQREKDADERRSSELSPETLCGAKSSELATRSSPCGPAGEKTVTRDAWCVTASLPELSQASPLGSTSAAPPAARSTSGGAAAPSLCKRATTTAPGAQ
jgi:hypothetical protein